MATWNRLVNNSNAGNVSLNIDYAVTNVNRSGNTVSFNYGIRFSMATSTWTSNNIAAFCPSGGTRYTAFNSGSGKNHTSKGTYYYANTSGATTTSEVTPFYFSKTVGANDTSLTFAVGFGWNAWSPSQKGSANITVSFPSAPPEPTPTPTPTPGAPNLGVNTYWSDSVQLIYASNITGATKARIYQDGSVISEENVYGQGNGTLTVSGLSPKTRYTFQIQLYDSATGLWSAMSNAVSVTTNPDDVTVGDVSVTDITPYSATVQVTSSNAADTEYYCYTLCNSRGTPIRDEVRETRSRYYLFLLDEETTYKIKVRVITRGSEDPSPYTTATFTTPADIGKCYIKVNGSWRYGKVYFKRNGSWIKSKGIYVRSNYNWYKGR